MIQPVFYIPNDVEFVIVSDMFAEDYAGGAELTLDGILQKASKPFLKLHSAWCTPKLVEAYRDK